MSVLVIQRIRSNITNEHMLYPINDQSHSQLEAQIYIYILNRFDYIAVYMYVFTLYTAIKVIEYSHTVQSWV